MYPYELRRSARRTLALEITREGRILVRAPQRLPQWQIDDFVASRQQWLDTHLQRQRQRRLAHPEPDEAGREACIRLAREVLPDKVARYAAEMGVTPAGVTITNARGRFGSCSGKNRLCFSWRLMMYPEAAVDYVVVHELAHIRHRDHSPAFYAFVQRFLPDWRARQALLRE